MRSATEPATDPSLAEPAEASLERRLGHLAAKARAAVWRRVRHARELAATEHLIAHAEVRGELLLVDRCDLTRLSVPLGKIRHGDGQPVVERFGAYLDWPDADLQLGLDDIRLALEPERQTAAQADAADADCRYGAAIRAVRERHGLKRTQIAGLSAAALGRLERGEQRADLAALTRLAAAHQLDVNAYLEAVAEAAAER